MSDSDQAKDQLKQLRELLGRPKKSFERAKVWSDYLAFHIRFLVFMTLSLVSTALFAEQIGSWSDQDTLERLVFLSLPIAILVFAGFALYMMLCIVSLNYDFFASKILQFFLGRLMKDKGGAVFAAGIAAVGLGFLVLVGFVVVGLALVEIAHLDGVR